MMELLPLSISLVIVLAGVILMALLAYKMIKRKTGRYYIVAVGILLIAVSSVLGFFLVALNVQQMFYSAFVKIIDVFAIVYIVYGV